MPVPANCRAHHQDRLRPRRAGRGGVAVGLHRHPGQPGRRASPTPTTSATGCTSSASTRLGLHGAAGAGSNGTLAGEPTAGPAGQLHRPTASSSADHASQVAASPDSYEIQVIGPDGAVRVPGDRPAQLRRGRAAPTRRAPVPPSTLRRRQRATAVRLRASSPPSSPTAKPSGPLAAAQLSRGSPTGRAAGRPQPAGRQPGRSDRRARARPARSPRRGGRDQSHRSGQAEQPASRPADSPSVQARAVAERAAAGVRAADWAAAPAPARCCRAGVRRVDGRAGRQHRCATPAAAEPVRSAAPPAHRGVELAVGR